MSVQAIATSLLLPPILLVLACLAAAVLAGRGRTCGAWLAAAFTCLLLLLATPFVAGHLRATLEQGYAVAPSQAPASPGAVIILSAEAVRGLEGTEPGPLTLERILAGVRSARRTGLPVLVTGGSFVRDDPPIASVMARVMVQDFALTPRWVEAKALDTRQNATFSAEILRREGISAAYVVTHAWHMPRTLEAFARTGLAVVPIPVRIHPVPDGQASDWLPNATQLATSWFMLREWAGLLVYRLRDGPARPRQ